MKLVIDYNLRKIFVGTDTESTLDIALDNLSSGESFEGFQEYVGFEYGYDGLDRPLRYDLHYSLFVNPIEETVKVYRFDLEDSNDDYDEEVFPEIIRIGTLEEMLKEIDKELDS